MDFQKKKYTFRGMDGYAGYRHGNEYELEMGTADAIDEEPAGVVVVNPVSRLQAHLSKAEFAEKWRKEQMSAYGTFRYELRDLVQLAWDAPVRSVMWRGWVLSRPPGARHRLAVYGPDDGHWGCYWEAELFPLGQAPRPAFNYVKPQQRALGLRLQPAGRADG